MTLGRLFSLKTSVSLSRLYPTSVIENHEKSTLEYVNSIIGDGWPIWWLGVCRIRDAATSKTSIG